MNLCKGLSGGLAKGLSKKTLSGALLKDSPSESLKRFFTGFSKGFPKRTSSETLEEPFPWVLYKPLPKRLQRTLEEILWENCRGDLERIS